MVTSSLEVDNDVVLGARRLRLVGRLCLTSDKEGGDKEGEETDDDDDWDPATEAAFVALSLSVCISFRMARAMVSPCRTAVPWRTFQQ